jgi:hypothetical protein
MQSLLSEQEKIDEMPQTFCDWQYGEYVLGGTFTQPSGPFSEFEILNQPLVDLTIVPGLHNRTIYLHGRIFAPGDANGYFNGHLDFYLDGFNVGRLNASSPQYDGGTGAIGEAALSTVSVPTFNFIDGTWINPNSGQPCANTVSPIASIADINQLNIFVPYSTYYAMTAGEYNYCNAASINSLATCKPLLINGKFDRCVLVCDDSFGISLWMTMGVLSTIKDSGYRDY